jgi:hypothetical protein
MRRRLHTLRRWVRRNFYGLVAATFVGWLTGCAVGYAIAAPAAASLVGGLAGMTVFVVLTAVSGNT